ncbi:jg20075, partial [Pararge aegeria aegeria]
SQGIHSTPEFQNLANPAVREGSRSPSASLPCVNTKPEYQTKYLEVSGLAHEPLLDELLRVLAEAQEEFAVGLQLVDRVHLRRSKAMGVGERRKRSVAIMEMQSIWSYFITRDYRIVSLHDNSNHIRQKAQLTHTNLNFRISV